MKALSRIWLPLAVTAMVIAGSVSMAGSSSLPARGDVRDTVVYREDGYKLHRRGAFEEVKIADSLITAFNDTTVFSDSLHVEDTVRVLTARDTIVAPDSLRDIDPFRYKYYVALVDSASHIFIRDSLMQSHDTLFAHEQFELASLDSLDAIMIDSLYSADSLAAVQAAFIAWYNSLDPKARAAYDKEQEDIRNLAIADSLRGVKELAKAVRDSIIENTPRILETFALKDSLQYQRIIRWNLDTDFHKMDVQIPDTSYNYYFYDFPFQRKDVNSTWLGTAGSPVLYYNFFNRKSDEGIDFYDANESWTVSPRTIWHYNTKTPYTEAAYWGTLLANTKKESDNIHLFTTQNITPEFNFSILYDRFGTGGILENENSSNKTFAPELNYLGKKYTMHAGYIYNKVVRGENGGMVDNGYIRDTIIESREIPVHLTDAASTIYKNTFFLDQQLCIPFNFIEKAKARKDTSYKFNPDSLYRDITTAYIGHSSEYSTYRRLYTDKITSDFAREFYHDDGVTESDDSLGVAKLENKIYFRIQPWSSDAVVSKVEAGLGDLMRRYSDSSRVNYDSHYTENNVFAYAGVEGQLGKHVLWDAKGKVTFAGDNAGDFYIGGNALLSVYPFRKAKGSPLNLSAHFETNLQEPTHFQKKMFTSHYQWENDFGKISTTKVEAKLDIPYWKLNASVGYSLVGNNVYYDENGYAQQHSPVINIFSAYLRKEFVIGNFLHLDNKVLFQHSSNQSVIPLPAVSLNLRYFIQFPVKKDIMMMQIGVNGFYNTAWYAPAWNPALGVFHNQNVTKYENGPYFDAFINMQWKRACIFIKYENAGQGWPMEKADYFSAHNFIVTQRVFKFGIFWPFYILPGKDKHEHEH